MARPLLATISLALFGALTGCGDDASTAGGSDAGTTADASTSGAPTTSDATTSGAPTSGAPTTGATDTTGDVAPAPAYARGLRLVRATANQAVQVEIVRDGLEVAGADYTSRLISRRKTVIRADWLLHADFTPREVIGRLTVWTPEGDTRVDEFKTMVAGPSNDGDLRTTFSWELPPEFVRPGLEYRIEALEVDAGAGTGEVSDPPPVLPLPGRGALAVHDDPMTMKVLIVPLQHTFGGMTCTPEVTDADLEAMRVAMEQHNPLERAELTLRAPLPYDQSIGTDQQGFVNILMAIAAARAKDKPPDNLYYYGVIQSCDGYPAGLLGQAYGIPNAPTKGNAWQRIATGRYLGSGAAAAETFVHEIGHCQGRYHVQCSGGEAGTDPAYPHPNGRIGVWGYGIHDNQMRSPTGFRDYMTYCPQSWVSDYGWELTFDTIRELSSWDAAGPAAGGEEDGVIVVGVWTADGVTRWYTTRGVAPAGDGAAELEFALPGGLLRAPAAVQAIPDSDARLVVAALPDGAAAMSGLTLRTGGTVRAQVPAAQVARLH